MLDRSIPFYNIIMKCCDYQNTDIILPSGYRFRNYQPGDEKGWAELEYEIGDFESAHEAEEYFLSQYGQKVEDLQERCFFALDEQSQIVGSCMAWKDSRGTDQVASLHWLVVSPDHQGKGLGTALCQKVLKVFWKKREFPVYIHTQPWSYIAILLYLSQGFRLQMRDTFSHYENQYAQAMDTLKEILPAVHYDELVANSD